MVEADLVTALRRHLPGHDVRDLLPLGEGQENRVYELGEAFVVRWRKEADREARRLAV